LFHFLSKNIKTKIDPCNVLIVYFVLCKYASETRALIQTREEHTRRLRVSENRVLRTIYAPKAAVAT
jgi:hypothetical protein